VTSLVALCFVDLLNEVEKIKIRYFTLGVILPFCRQSYNARYMDNIVIRRYYFFSSKIRLFICCKGFKEFPHAFTAAVIDFFSSGYQFSKIYHIGRGIVGYGIGQN
jgi:hypothetical protein